MSNEIAKLPAKMSTPSDRPNCRVNAVLQKTDGMRMKR